MGRRAGDRGYFGRLLNHCPAALIDIARLTTVTSPRIGPRPDRRDCAAGREERIGGDDWKREQHEFVPEAGALGQQDRSPGEEQQVTQPEPPPREPCKRGQARRQRDQIEHRSVGRRPRVRRKAERQQVLYLHQAELVDVPGRRSRGSERYAEQRQSVRGHVDHVHGHHGRHRSQQPGARHGCPVPQPSDTGLHEIRQGHQCHHRVGAAVDVRPKYGEWRQQKGAPALRLQDPEKGDQQRIGKHVRPRQHEPRDQQDDVEAEENQQVEARFVGLLPSHEIPPDHGDRGGIQSRPQDDEPRIAREREHLEHDHLEQPVVVDPRPGRRHEGKEAVVRDRLVRPDVPSAGEVVPEIRVGGDDRHAEEGGHGEHGQDAGREIRAHFHDVEGVDGSPPEVEPHGRASARRRSDGFPMSEHSTG